MALRNVISESDSGGVEFAQPRVPKACQFWAADEFKVHEAVAEFG